LTRSTRYFSISLSRIAGDPPCPAHGVEPTVAQAAIETDEFQERTGAGHGRASLRRSAVAWAFRLTAKPTGLSSCDTITTSCTRPQSQQAKRNGTPLSSSTP